jgi:hypothetical protein
MRGMQDWLLFGQEWGRTDCPIPEFEEDLEDGVADNWVDDGSGVWSVADGVYKMTGSSPAQNTVRYSYHDANYSDFTYQVDVRRTQGSLDSSLGMLFRGDGTLQNLYIFQINRDGYYFIGKKANGSAIVLVSPTYSSTINKGYDVWNTLKVVCHGSTMQFYINDMVVNSLDDSEFSSGKVGVHALDVCDTSNIIHFDNVELWSLTNGPQGGLAILHISFLSIWK